jgi:hypothetical protein
MVYANFDMKDYFLILLFSTLVIGISFSQVFMDKMMFQKRLLKMLIQLYII